jgi:geranylgeranyl diphosphate synthase type II
VNNYQSLLELFLKHLEEYKSNLNSKSPKELYEPENYILSLGGKRLRPLLALVACDLFDKDPKHALNSALAVELFHNFSLIHDDILDAAPLRRNKETVHVKWNTNIAILSGDVMLVKASQVLENYDFKEFKKLNILFNKTAIEVCEGQQYDVDFETRDDVTISEYLKMIEYKTAVLVGAAMKMGAIVAETSEQNSCLIYDFGLNLGIAFQLQDDYLDAFGDPETFGKQVGGDIIENKKTYLYLKAMEFAAADEKEQLSHLFSIQPNDNSDKIHSVKEIFNQTGASEATQKAIQDYTFKAFETLEKMNISSEKKLMLRAFGKKLMNRNV